MKNKKYIKTLYHNKWLSLKSISCKEFGDQEYVFSHETRCNGKILSILPFRRNNEGIVSEFLIRKEVTPCWGTKQFMSSITGGIEGEDHFEHALIELNEEAGYVVKKEDLYFIGNCFGSKSCDTIYSLFSVDLTEKTKTAKASGDGSFMETLAHCEWVNEDELEKAVDPLIFANWFKLIGYLTKNKLFIKKRNEVGIK